MILSVNPLIYVSMSKLFRRHLIKVSSFSGSFTIFRCKVLQQLCHTCADQEEDSAEHFPPDTTSHYIEDNRCEDDNNRDVRITRLSVYCNGVRSNLK